MIKKGFTLAEVLMTMAIIGIVATLTIPTLSADYEKRVITTQLQKVIAQLSQSGAMVLSDEMTDDFNFSKAIREGYFLDRYVKGELRPENEIFSSTYSSVGGPSSSDLFSNLDDTRACMMTQAGAAVCVDRRGFGIIDANGSKGPNSVGRDAFPIRFSEDGSVDTTYCPELNNIIKNNWDLDNFDGHSDGGGD